MSRLRELMSELCPDGVEYKRLGEVLKLHNGKDYRHLSSGNIPVYGTGGIMTYVDSCVYDKPSVLIPRKGSLNKLYYVDVPFWNVDTIFYSEIFTDIANPKFIYYVLEHEHLESLNEAGAVPSLTQKTLNKILIPVPPLEVQAEIVRILGTFTSYISLQNRELTLRRQQYEYYRDKLLTFGDDVRRTPLGEIGKVCMCKRILKRETQPNGEIPFYKIGTFGGVPDAYISRELFERYRKTYPYPRKGEVLISAAGTIGKTVIFDGNDAYFQDSNIVWIANNEAQVLNKFLYYIYQLNNWTVTKGGTIKRLYNNNLTSTIIPLPPIDKQIHIASILDRFDSLCNNLSHGLPAEIQARLSQYQYYRDKLLSFREKS